MAITPTYVASGALLRGDESSRGAGPENSIGRWQLALPTRFELHAVLISRSSLSAWIERALACRSVLRASSISAWPCQPFQKSRVLSRSGRYVQSPVPLRHIPLSSGTVRSIPRRYVSDQIPNRRAPRSSTSNHRSRSSKTSPSACRCSRYNMANPRRVRRW